MQPAITDISMQDVLILDILTQWHLRTSVIRGEHEASALLEPLLAE